MFAYVAKKLWGSANDRIVKSLQSKVIEINSLEPAFQKLTDAELVAKTNEFRTRLSQGTALDSLLPEAFATVRESARRVRNMRHFDVQLIGGMILHKGMIAEMKTGEGKTVVATLAAYLNALPGKGVHIVTTNDYLAQRDAEWMGAIYTALGLSVGYIVSAMPDEARQQAYNCDITYGTNNEFGFDYLRDNLKYNLHQMVQRPFHYAIVDEVDSILIDESRTPLIISGAVENNVNLYAQINELVPHMSAGDYELDEKARSVSLTDQGHEKVEELLKAANMLPKDANLFELGHIAILHLINQGLRAHKLYKIDKDYIVKDRRVHIIDEFTGRIMEGRRFSEGLHQALEAKEQVPIQNENQTLASVTYQNYFRMYPKLSGMTGTAMTEAQEFADIYKLEVVAIPTNMPVRRQDDDDVIYRTEKEKLRAILEEIKKLHAANQPVLVGTISIEKSEMLARLLSEAKIPHNVLNARYHAQEAEIIAQAGQPGAVTIATNMAGRGTDIKLGGNEEMLLLQALAQKPDTQIEILAQKIKTQVAQDKEKVIQAGGLFILGTERHESRRIDNQLRGRAGRQGDPGATRFYLSLEDDLMRIFGSEKISSMLVRMGLREDEAIIHPWVSKALEKAQQKVEARNYEARKNLLRYDDVMNDQRRVIYEQRRDILNSSGLSDLVLEFSVERVMDLVAAYLPANSLPEEWNLTGLEGEILALFNLHLPLSELANKDGVANDEIINFLNEQIKQAYESKSIKYGDALIEAQQYIFISTLDHLWKEHLHTLDYLRTGIYLRSYAQKDPLNEYKLEAFRLFQHMLEEYTKLIIRHTFHLEMGEGASKNTTAEQAKTVANDVNAPVSRNSLCPCGSGKKYKHCHGALKQNG